MTPISGALSADHARCDAAFADMEAAAGEADWTGTTKRFESFDQDMRRHFDFEEQVLFPALEHDPSGVPLGPVTVMREEHDEMRALLDELRSCLEQRDSEEFIGQAQTLLIVLQQHNVKEEQVLYPLADETLAPGDVETIVEQLQGWGIESV